MEGALELKLEVTQTSKSERQGRYTLGKAKWHKLGGFTEQGVHGNLFGGWLYLTKYGEKRGKEKEMRRSQSISNSRIRDNCAVTH